MTVVLLIDSRAKKETRAAEHELRQLGIDVTSVGNLEEAKLALETCAAEVALIDALALVIQPGLRDLMVERQIGVIGFGANSEAQALQVDAWLPLPLRGPRVKAVLDDVAKRSSATAAYALSTAAQRRRQAAADEEVEARAGLLAPGLALETAIGLSRARATGELTIASDRATFRLFFNGGLIVGATDDGAEHRFLNLMQGSGRIDDVAAKSALRHAEQNGLRIAEALLAIGACTAKEIAIALRVQVLARAQAALSISQGAYTFATSMNDDVPSTVPVDMYTIAPAVGAVHVNSDLVNNWIVRNRARSILRTEMFQLALDTRPDLRVPGLDRSLASSATLAGVVRLVHAEAGRSAGERAAGRMWTLHQLGSFFFDGEPQLRALPVVQETEAAGATEVVERVFETWVRADGRDLFALLDVSRTADQATLETAYRAACSSIGRDSIGDVPLGLATDAAESLWLMLDEVPAMVLDPEARARYVEELGNWEMPQTGSDIGPEVEAEGHLRAAKLLRSSGHFIEATRELESAARLVDDNEIHWLLAWTRFQAQPTPETRVAARSAVIHLAQDCAGHGDLTNARDYLEQASQIFTHDDEVLLCRQELGIAPQTVVHLLDDIGVDLDFSV